MIFSFGAGTTQEPMSLAQHLGPLTHFGSVGFLQLSVHLAIVIMGTSTQIHHVYHPLFDQPLSLFISSLTIIIILNNIFRVYHTLNTFMVRQVASTVLDNIRVFVQPIHRGFRAIIITLVGFKYPICFFKLSLFLVILILLIGSISELDPYHIADILQPLYQFRLHMCVYLQEQVILRLGPGICSIIGWSIEIN